MKFQPDSFQLWEHALGFFGRETEQNFVANRISIAVRRRSRGTDRIIVLFHHKGLWAAGTLSDFRKGTVTRRARRRVARRDSFSLHPFASPNPNADLPWPRRCFDAVGVLAHCGNASARPRRTKRPCPPPPRPAPFRRAPQKSRLSDIGLTKTSLRMASATAMPRSNALFAVTCWPCSGRHFIVCSPGQRCALSHFYGFVVATPRNRPICF